MNNKKTTKRALLSSVMAMLICITMLIGTTFAWFTDSASTAVNKIQAGTLNVALEMYDGTTWVDAEGKTLQFKVNGQIPAEGTQILWEPGCTYELPAVKIVNKGNLALKYTISLNGVQGNAKLLEAIDFTVKVGDTETALDQLNGTLLANAESAPIVISGHMKKSAGNEYQGLSIDGIAITVNATQKDSEYDSFNNTYDKDAVLPVNATASGNLTVTSNSTQNSAVVSGNQTLSDGVMSVTYPGGVKLKTTGEVTGDTEKKTTTVNQSLTYVGATPSSAMASITIGDGKAVAQYELTLPVAEDNTAPVTVTINYAKGLTGVQVYHSGTLLTTTANANGESAVYDAATGVLTLTLKHASPIDIVYNAVVPANAKFVKTLAELKDALDAGETYIILGANIDMTGSGGSEQAIALKDTTIDLNGYTIKGSIFSGSYSSSADGTRLTLTDSAAGGQIYSKYRLDGGAMMQHTAVFALQHAVTINGGTYQSNNVAIVCQVQNTNAAEGVIINGGTIKGSNDLIEGVNGLPGPVGGCVEAVIGTVTINGGTFEAAQYGSVIIAESGSSRCDTVVNINGGTFSGACMFDFGKDHSSKSIVNVYGGDFTVKNPDPDESVLKATSFAYDNYTHAALVNNDMFELNIMGGTFNMDPSAYVDTDNYNVTQNGSTWTVTAK